MSWANVYDMLGAPPSGHHYVLRTAKRSDPCAPIYGEIREACRQHHGSCSPVDDTWADLPTPCSDRRASCPGWGNIRDHQNCGATPEQFPLWFPPAVAEALFKHGLCVHVFCLPTNHDDVLFLLKQVVFPAREHTPIFTFINPPEWLQ